MHNIYFVTYSNCPPQRHCRNNIVKCETLCDSVSHNTKNLRESQAVVTFCTCSKISERLQLIT